MGYAEERFRAGARLLGLLGAVALGVGCASPGTPRPPSLQLPEVVRDLTAARAGEAVEVRFTVPSRTPDGTFLRGAEVRGSLCRQEDKGGPCREVDALETAAPLAVTAPAHEVVWRDVLPAALGMGPVRAVAYRVELRNGAGRSAGYSDAAYAAAGSAPPAVEGFVAQGVRSGVLLEWRPEAGTAELLVRRERLEGVPAGRGGVDGRSGSQGDAVGASRRGSGAGNAAREAVVWLKAGAEGARVPEMVDGTIEEGVRYRYSAVRAETVRVGGRMLEVRGAASGGVEIAWRDVYPPAAPRGLTALGFATGSGGGAGPAYAVDLVWEPVNDPRVTGYVVMRARLDAAGAAVGAAERLTAGAVTTPGFHDAGALAGEGYRYEVRAVDAQGNVSAPAVGVVLGTR